MTHTPGPWIVFHADGISSVMPAMRAGDICDNIMLSDDAKLIAAAPDLLEVVRLFQGMGWKLEDDAHGMEIRRRALAAVQKAGV